MAALEKSDIHIFTLNQDWSTPPPAPTPVVFILLQFCHFFFFLCVSALTVGLVLVSILAFETGSLLLNRSDSTLLTGQKSPGILLSLSSQCGDCLLRHSLHQTHRFNVALRSSCLWQANSSIAFEMHITFVKNQASQGTSVTFVHGFSLFSPALFRERGNFSFFHFVSRLALAVLLRTLAD